MAYKTGWNDSGVKSAAYVITGTVATPTFSPDGGTYTSAQNVAIATSTSGATIRYTTDGTTPTSTIGTIYSAPVAIAGDTTLKAVAYKTGWNDSGVKSAGYVITVNEPPVASFTYTCYSANFTCDFDASASVGGIANYAWDFGDGSGGGIGPLISHTYSKQGSYTVGLIITDNDNQAGTVSTDVRVPKKGTTSGGTDPGGDTSGGGNGGFCASHPTHKKCNPEP